MKEDSRKLDDVSSGFPCSGEGNNYEKTMNVRTLTFIAMMGAVSTVLMMLNFSIPFAPGFLKFDISELSALFTGFFFGPE